MGTSSPFQRTCPRTLVHPTGRQGAGKTTMVRALCAEIPPGESIGTFETEYELHLHEMKDRHPIVHAWEARPGGELQANGRRAGEFTLDDALYDSYRFNLSRQIVGEVRGKEVLAMIEAMQSGTGSLSTTHAESAEAAVGKLVTCAMKAGAHVTHEYAVRAIAEALDIIVHVDMRTEPLAGGGFRKRRWTSQIAILTPGEQAKGYAMSTVFGCPPRSTAIAAVGGMPEEYRDLARLRVRPGGLHRPVPAGIMTPLVPAVGGALVVAGVLGVALGAQRRPLSPPSPRRGPAVPRLRLSRRSRLLLAGWAGGRCGAGAGDRLVVGGRGGAGRGGGVADPVGVLG